MKLYMFRSVPLSIIRSFSLYTQQWYVSYKFADSLRAGSGWNCVPSWSCSQVVCKTVWHISLLCVQWKTPDDGQRNCSKHVDFNFKNKFEKLVHLVSFIIRYDMVVKMPNCKGWVVIQELHWTYFSVISYIQCNSWITTQRLQFGVLTTIPYVIIKPTRCTNYSNLFLKWNSTCFGQFLCLSSGVFHCTHSNGICHTDLLCVQWLTPDDGQRNCPKHVEFHFKNKFD